MIDDAAAVAPLISALKDEDADVRRIAAQALGRLKDRRAIEPLVTVLTDRESAVRTSSTNAS